MPDVAPKPPAKKAAGAKKVASAPRSPGRPSNADKLRESLTATYMTVGVIGTPIVGKAFGLTDAQAAAAAAGFVASAPACADAWVQLAETNPAVRQAIEKMSQTGGWATVITAHAALGMAIVGAIRENDPADEGTAELPFDPAERVSPDPAEAS